MIKRVINWLLKRFEKNIIPTKNKVVYLTFDDGPEEGITEFVLEELEKYRFKATFFCMGKNVEKHRNLFFLLKEKGHSIGNHSYSHVHAYNVPTSSYLSDVEQADTILKTTLFRPPHGSLTLLTFLYLFRRYSIFYWSLNSGDSDKERFNLQRSISMLKERTQKGDIVLFHFCHKHENETRQLLPIYLEWLYKNNFKSESL